MIGVVELPWPSRRLHPNARTHWRPKSVAIKKARLDARFATMAAGLTTLDLASLKATIVFHPPDNRRRDLDSMLASMKAAIDGISDVIGVDDSQWELAIRKDEPVKYGAVKIMLERADV